MILDRALLYDTPAHAATTALTVIDSVCEDPVRHQAARSVFGLIEASAVSGDGSRARRRAGSVVALTGDAAKADARSAALAQSFERWLLHPGRDNAQELTSASRDFTADASEELCLRAWRAGAGLDAAVDTVLRDGLHETPPEAVSLIGAACAELVPMVWVARHCGVSRDAVYRRVRVVGADQWHRMLGGDRGAGARSPAQSELA